MSGQLVVKRYVKALILVAEEAGIMDSVKKDIDTVSRILKEREISDFCLRLNTSRKREVEFVKTAFIPYVSEYTGRFIMVMTENGRIAALPLVGTAFEEIMEQRGGYATVLLETAHEPDDKLITLIKNRMAERLRKNIILKTAVESNLLGGFRIIWQNRIIDMSVKGRLKKMRVILK